MIFFLALFSKQYPLLYVYIIWCEKAQMRVQTQVHLVVRSPDRITQKIHTHQTESVPFETSVLCVHVNIFFRVAFLEFCYRFSFPYAPCTIRGKQETWKTKVKTKNERKTHAEKNMSLLKNERKNEPKLVLVNGIAVELWMYICIQLACDRQLIP